MSFNKMSSKDESVLPLDVQETGAGAACFSPFILSCYDWWVFGFSNRFGWRCSTHDVLIPHFKQHVSDKHLDIGVGTGFYYANIGNLSGKNIRLMDLNFNCLKTAEKRANDHGADAVSIVQHDVFKPFPFQEDEAFSSVSSFYLFNCLPGNNFNAKEPAVRNIHAVLREGGVYFGATVLGNTPQKGEKHNFVGQSLINYYNRKHIFGNENDTAEDLRRILERYFSHVEFRVEGVVALFSATK